MKSLGEFSAPIKLIIAVGTVALGIGSSWAMVSVKATVTEEKVKATADRVVNIELEADRARVHEARLDANVENLTKSMERIERKLDRLLTKGDK